jgi:mono/diheme cytochrome c family protein
MRTGLIGAAGLVGLVLLAGCGGADGGETMGPGMTGDGGMGGPPAASTSAGGAPSGRELFLASGCGACHALDAAGTSGGVGPDLDDAMPGYDTVRSTVRRGKGAMPAYADRLTTTQIDAIARFVASATG